MEQIMYQDDENIFIFEIPKTEKKEGTASQIESTTKNPAAAAIE